VNQGDAAKPVIKKVKKSPQTADVGDEKQDQVNDLENGVKKTKERVPRPQADAGGKGVEPEQLQRHAEKAKPKFKTPDLDSGEVPKTVKKKAKPAPPEPEQGPEHEDEAASDHNEEEHEGRDYEDDENGDDYHE